MSLECIGKLGHDLGFSPFADIEHTLSIEIVKQANVIVSTPRGGLVETDRGDGREVLLSVRLTNVMVRGYASRARACRGPAGVPRHNNADKQIVSSG